VNFGVSTWVRLVCGLALLFEGMQARAQAPEAESNEADGGSEGSASEADESDAPAWYDRGRSAPAAVDEVAPGNDGNDTRESEAGDSETESDHSTEAPPDGDSETAAGAPMPTAEPPDDGFVEGFAFGSYGRVVAASDLRGGLGREADIVAFNPRVDEDVYMELELRRQDRLGAGMRSKVVATVAFGGPFFHLDAEFQEAIAIRNLYAEVQNFLTPGFHLWAGSRMWRGDDVYLLNFWPLDNLNTIGGGFDYDIAQAAQVRFVIGLARPDDPFHRQVSGAIPTSSSFLPEEVRILDRPRATVAAKATWWLFGRRARTGAKAILYGEGHFLPSGEREVDGGGLEVLPQDSGYVIGAQLGGYVADSNAFVNLFFRHARGLAVYNPLGVPFSTGAVQSTERARETLLAISGNYEVGLFGVQLGAYYRNFRDADPNVFQRGRLAEGAVSVRPHVWFGQYAGLSVDLSYQAMQTTQLDERTGQITRGGVTKIAFIPFASPFGRGTYTRPHLRLIYSLTIRDDDAQRLYPDEDPRSQQATEHFLGIGAEWWFDSTSYGQ